GYRLATAGQQRALLDALDSNAEPHENKRRYSDNGRIWQEDAAVRNAAHGLVQLGCEAVPGLQDVALKGTPRGRKHAAFALGEIGSEAAIPTLIEAMSDDDVHVRIAAAEAIVILPPSGESRDALLSAMCDSASEVRFDAALSLVRAASQGSTELIAPTVGLLEEALYDTNRYVSGYAAEALERIGTAGALEALLPFLRTARWCPHTDNQHPF
ncbi:MAG: HEAT repeat domain-containing protein, partial [Gammaproteobacteria bacterium]|nr:HEAT repeat domain-containing protein [Gammaproteobacteria bacterium]